MRLIDADALLDDLVFSSEALEKTFTELINDVPTVEVNRKKGKWLKPTGLSNPICSECHSCPNLLYGLTSKFCPNCGAEMEEK